MIQICISAPSSGQGKTILTCALLTALQKRGWSPCAFKCGPDYIDPMFHRSILGVECWNLDVFLSDPAGVRERFAQGIRGHDAVICEGAMGFYDGLGAVSDYASAWHTADILHLPVLMVIQVKGAAYTLAAVLRGLRDFRADHHTDTASGHTIVTDTASGHTIVTDSASGHTVVTDGVSRHTIVTDSASGHSHIAGVILNDCSPMLCHTLAPIMERETGIPVLGCLPRMEEAKLPRRHLGLYTAAEIHGLRTRFDTLAQTLEQNVDMGRLLDCFSREESGPVRMDPRTVSPICAESSIPVRVGVARDEAFCFIYTETLELFRSHGAELIFYSPLHDAVLPEGLDALYLPGGYPELYADKLSRNVTMRQTIADAVRAGLPTVAECGGFLYLGHTLTDTAGGKYPMVDVLPGEGYPAGKSVRFGYGYLTASRDSLLFRKGESIPVHEFHHWDTTCPGDDLYMRKPLSGRTWKCGFVSDTLYAGFPHFYFAGTPVLAQRFLTAARNYHTANTPWKDHSETSAQNITQNLHETVISPNEGESPAEP